MPPNLVYTDLEIRWYKFQSLKKAKSTKKNKNKEKKRVTVSNSTFVPTQELVMPQIESNENEDGSYVDEQYLQESTPPYNFTTTGAIESSIDLDIIKLARQTFIQDLYECSRMMENHAHMFNTIYVPDHIVLNVKSLKLWLKGIFAQFSGIYSIESIILFEHFTKSVLN